MGGGDLNSKKSWHPNTMKNQERVWKAEQAAAEEKKRMLELQRERAEERDRAELHDIMNKHSAADNRLAWMYDKPDKKVEQEAYLLGKALDKNSGQSDNVEPDGIPAVSRRVVGSSMLTVGGAGGAGGAEGQVDMSRKLREDPLLLIKERERAARAALLNNPLQRRKLAQLLRTEQDQRKETKAKKKSKKKDKNLDDLLAAKLNALGGQKGIDLATLLDSDDSSSDSERTKSKKKKHKRDKQKKKKKKRAQSSESESDTSTHMSKQHARGDHMSDKTSSQHRSDKTEEYSRKRGSSAGRRRSASPVAVKYQKREHPDSRRNDRASPSKGSRYDRRESSVRQGARRRSRSDDDDDRRRRRSAERQPRRDSGDRELRRGSADREPKRRCGMSEQERAAKLAEMAAAGAAREADRGRRVAEQRAADVSEARGARESRGGRAAPALPASLESRLNSTRHYIQRDKRHMNENFARR